MEFVTYEQDGYVGIITINRPKALNALNSAVLEELDATFDAVDLDTTRAVVFTGAGDKSFVAGADIGEMSTLTKAEGEAFGKKETMCSEDRNIPYSSHRSSQWIRSWVADVRFQ